MTCSGQVVWSRKSAPTAIKDVPFVKFAYPEFTGIPGRVTVGSSGLFRCVPCLLNAVNSLCLLIPIATVHIFCCTVVWRCLIMYPCLYKALALKQIIFYAFATYLQCFDWDVYDPLVFWETDIRLALILMRSANTVYNYCCVWDRLLWQVPQQVQWDVHTGWLGQVDRSGSKLTILQLHA